MSMEIVLSTIELDVYDHDTTPTTIKTIALDNLTRIVHAYLKKEGAVYQPDPSAKVDLIALRPDKVAAMSTGSVILLEEETVKGPSVYGLSAEITTPMIAVEGIVLFQFRLTQGNDVLRTEIFTADNGRALDGSAEEWADKYEGYNVPEMMEKLEFLVRSYESQMDPDIQNAMLSTHLYMDRKVSVHDNALYIDDPNAPFSGEEWIESYFNDVVKATTEEWLEENPEARSLVADGTITEAKLDSALKNKLNKDYVTPQMFGTIGEGADADLIREALAASSQVYLPAGVYEIDSTIEIPHTSHVWGDPAKTVLKAVAGFTGAYMIQIAPTTGSVPDRTSFCLEDIELQCNSLVGGMYLARPYNRCVLRCVTVTYCPTTALSVGDNTPGKSTGDTRSQTLVVDGCYFQGTDNTEVQQSGPLAYFYNCFEINLKDTKIMYSSVNKPTIPCVVFDYCYDFFVRGCSFANSFCEAIKIKRNCRYFRLIANTYENIAYRSSAYIRSDQTARSNTWLASDSAGANVITPSVAGLYQLKANSGSYTAGRLFRWNGEMYIDVDEELYHDYIIDCDGVTEDNLGGAIIQGIILETAYYSTNRNIRLDNTNYMMVIGSFRNVVGDNNTNLTFYSTLDNSGSLLTTDSFVYKDYTVSTETNSRVAPWSAYNSVDISSDINKYGNPLSVTIVSSGSGATTNPACAMVVNDSRIAVYSASAADFTVRAAYRK